MRVKESELVPTTYLGLWHTGDCTCGGITGENTVEALEAALVATLHSKLAPYSFGVWSIVTYMGRNVVAAGEVRS